MNFSFEHDIILQNERVLLRPLLTTDLPYLLPVATEPGNLVKFSPYSIHTEDQLKQYIDSSIIERVNNLRYPFIIFDHKTQQYAGSTSIANVSNKDLRFEIGWTWIGTNFQRTGLNRNCKFLLLQYAFDTLEFERVEFKTDARNVQSRTAMEEMGAVYEGALRSHTVMMDGYRRTTVYYSILKDEWKELKTTFLRK
ncbi:MAG TPA: GNAT family protein [Flavisolibacter sp.]|nr:GNAT family protein [Flavisolibacter sp.]